MLEESIDNRMATTHEKWRGAERDAGRVGEDSGGGQGGVEAG